MEITGYFSKLIWNVNRVYFIVSIYGIDSDNINIINRPLLINYQVPMPVDETTGLITEFEIKPVLWIVHLKLLNRIHCIVIL